MNFALRKKIGGRRQEGGSSNSTNIHLDLFREKLSRLGCYNILKRKTGFQHIFISLHLLGKAVIIQICRKT